MKTKSGTNNHHLSREIRNQFLGHATLSATDKSNLRVVLYSHDTMGIGHLRRNILIASMIKHQFPTASILVIAGAREACTFSQAASLDCLTLPSFKKQPDGTYTSRSLGISADEMLNFRSRTILAAIQSYQPDLFIVDKIPSGAGGELLPSLDWISRHAKCHCVLGLRDILDDAEKVKRDWTAMHSDEIIRAHFREIWIYGDPHVYDAVKEYEFPQDIADRVTYTGYLDTRSRLPATPDQEIVDDEPFVLCTLGGGQDGKALALNFIEAIRQSERQGTLLTGPHMPDSTKSLVFGIAETVPSLRVIEFADEGDLLVRNASHVVSMGGYNTLSAILSYRKPALIVPRVCPREEQLIRANRFAELGLVQMIHPDELTPDSIIRWLSETNESHRSSVDSPNLQGLQRICASIHARFPLVNSILNGKTCDA